jgi:uncharacterized membrane protein YgcG
MSKRSHLHSRRLILSAILTATIGCKSNEGLFGIDRCADIPCGAIPAKPGTQLCQWQQAQVASASTDLGVFYQADFIGTTDELGPAARKHVDRMVQQGLVGKVPVILDPSEDPQRDEARTVALASAFTNAGAAMSPDQIQVAYPPALGLSAVNAQQATQNLSRQGGGGQGGGGLGGGMTGGGMGGGFGGGGMF